MDPSPPAACVTTGTVHQYPHQTSHAAFTMHPVAGTITFIYMIMYMQAFIK